MTLGNLRKVIAAYHQVTAAELIVDGFDLGLAAINNARKAIERAHDFWNQQEQVRVVVSPTTGGDLTTAKLASDNTTVKAVKTVESVYWENDEGNLVPIALNTQRNLNIWARERIRRRNVSGAELRYPSDAWEPSTSFIGNQQQGSRILTAYVFGSVIKLDPAASANTNVILDANTWITDWVDADNAVETWILKHGSEYLQWAAIVELNFKFGTFVPRQEGFVAPPDKMAKAKMDELVAWDVYTYETARQLRGPR